MSPSISTASQRLPRIFSATKPPKEDTPAAELIDTADLALAPELIIAKHLTALFSLPETPETAAKLCFPGGKFFAEGFRRLIQGAFVEHVIKNGYYGEFSPLAELLIHTTDRLGRTPLLAAAEINDLASLKNLLAVHGVDVNAGDYTALHYAAKHGNVAMIETLAEAPGINPNIKNKGGYSPLEAHFTIPKANDEEVLRAFLKIPGIIISAPQPLINLLWQPKLWEIVEKSGVAIADFNPNQITTDHESRRLTYLQSNVLGGHQNILRYLLRHPQLDINLRTENIYPIDYICIVIPPHSTTLTLAKKFREFYTWTYCRITGTKYSGKCELPKGYDGIMDLNAEEARKRLDNYSEIVKLLEAAGATE